MHKITHPTGLTVQLQHVHSAQRSESVLNSASGQLQNKGFCGICLLTPALILLGTIKDKSAHFVTAIEAGRIPQAEPRAEQILLNHLVGREMRAGR